MSENNNGKNGKYMLSKVKLNYPKLFTPDAFQGQGDAKYSAKVVIPKDDPNCKLIEQGIKAALAACKPSPFAYKSLKHPCYVDGDTLTNGSGEPISEYEGCMVLTVKANEKNPPVLLNRAAKRMTTATSAAERAKDDRGQFYSGVTVNIQVSFYASKNKYGNQLFAQVLAVQHVADTEKWGGGAPAAELDAFDAVEGAEDDNGGFTAQDDEDMSDLF